MLTALIVFGSYAFIVWMKYRAMPATNSRSEHLRGKVLLSNELASLIGAAGTLVPFCGLDVTHGIRIYAGGLGWGRLRGRAQTLGAATRVDHHDSTRLSTRP